MNSQHDDFEIEFFEKIIESRPHHVDAVTSLAEAYTAKGLYHEGLEMDLRLSELKPDDPTVFYNLACSYALTGGYDAAFETLEKAIELGYLDWRHMKEDADFDLIRHDPRFSQLIEKLQQKIKTLTGK